MIALTFEIRSEAKIRWVRLDRGDCEEEILLAELDDVATVTKENIEFALCHFIVEVKKSKSDDDYPGRTLYQILCALQNHFKKC